MLVTTDVKLLVTPFHFRLLPPTKHRIVFNKNPRYRAQMPEMVPESKILPGWIVQRFGGVSIQKFGVKIVEDIVKLVPLQMIYISGSNLLTVIGQVSRETE